MMKSCKNISWLSSGLFIIPLCFYRIAVCLKIKNNIYIALICKVIWKVVTSSNRKSDITSRDLHKHWFIYEYIILPCSRNTVYFTFIKQFSVWYIYLKKNKYGKYMVKFLPFGFLITILPKTWLVFL